MQKCVRYRHPATIRLAMSIPAEKRDLRLMRAMFSTIAPRYDFITRIFSYCLLYTSPEPVAGGECPVQLRGRSFLQTRGRKADGTSHIAETSGAPGRVGALRHGRHSQHGPQDSVCYQRVEDVHRFATSIALVRAGGIP